MAEQVSVAQLRRAGLRPDGTPARVTKRRAETRERLLRAAFQVFARTGFGHTSIEEVCEAAGFSRGAFYSNFHDLDELFFALYEQRAQGTAQHVANALAGSPEGCGVGTLIEHVTNALVFDRDWLLIKTDFLLHAARNNEVGTAWTAHRDRLREALADLLRRVPLPDGLPASLREPLGLANAVVAVYDGATTPYLLHGDRELARACLVDLLTAMLDHTDR